MKFSLFRKPKPQHEPEKPVEAKEEPKADAVQPEEPKQEAAATPQEPTPATEPEPTPEPIQAPPQETSIPPPEQKPEPAEPASKTYLKAMPLKELSDIENVKKEVKNGNILFCVLRLLQLKA